MTEPRLSGKRLRAARVARGWTQERLGELAGFPEKRRGITISELEAGKGDPRGGRVAALADVLSVPIEWLYGAGASHVPVGRKGAA